MKKEFTYFLVLVFFVFSVTPGALYAGGGGGCGDSEGCNNTMYGIAIGTTLLLVGYLYYDHQKSNEDAKNKEDDKEIQEASSVQPKNSNKITVSPEIAVYRW